MKLYRVSIGHTELFAAGIDSDDIYNRRESLDHTFAYLPIVIEEVKLEGYEITVTPSKAKQDSVVPIELMHRDHLKQWLTNRNIPFTPQWGEEKLRELALSVAN
jgi:hypothetical protein